MSQAYNEFVDALVRLLDETRALPLGGLPPEPAPRLLDNAPRALLFAPHPDDESITGGLPLRLRRELRFRVTAVAVTQGSRIDRQSERLEEMREASHFLGFELIPARLNSLTGITARSREQNPDAWEDAVAAIAGIISYHRATVIFLPAPMSAPTCWCWTPWPAWVRASPARWWKPNTGSPWSNPT